MESKKFLINNDIGRTEAISYITEDFVRDAKLAQRDGLRVDLLVEEALGMVKAMVDDYFGQLWITGDDRGCEIHMELVSRMTGDKREELLSVSRSGENASARGFMAKIGDFLSRSMHSFTKVVDAYGAETMRYGIVSGGGIETPTVYDMTPVWSLEQYRMGLAGNRATSDEADAAWDELEKSIVANLADDVIVGVKGDRVQLVIVKRFKH